MSARFAILCPGQGAQHAGMFALARSYPASAAWLDHTGQTNIDGCEHQEVVRFDNRHAQALIVRAGLANWLALQSLLPAAANPLLVAGYSVGEITAHAVAGHLAMDNAVALVEQRAALMQACIDPAQPQGMLALRLQGGLQVGQLAELFAQWQLPLQIAIVISQQRCLVAGWQTQIEQALPRLQQIAHCSSVSVQIASHTSLMANAQAPFEKAMQQVTWHTGACPVLAGVDACASVHEKQIQQSLSAQLSQPVRWDLCMEQLAESRLDFALELGPGNALSRMLNEYAPQIACRSIDDFRRLDGLARWVQRFF